MKPLDVTTSQSVRINDLMVYIPDNEVFKVLCSCPSSRPIHHRLAWVKKNPAQYRHPTQEERDGYHGRKGTGTSRSI